MKLPEGTFALRRGLVLKNGVELVGAGMDKTILTPARKPISFVNSSYTRRGSALNVPAFK